MFERIGSHRGRCFGVMDFTQGLHQLALAELAISLTAFITFCGVYEFLRVPFGPKNAPSYFQQQLDHIVLAGLLYLIRELYIYDDTNEEFLKNLLKVFLRIRQYKCVLKPSKSKLGKSQIEYVGKVLSHDSITMRDETTKKVLNFPETTRVKQIQRFIGLVITTMQTTPS